MPRPPVINHNCDPVEEAWAKLHYTENGTARHPEDRRPAPAPRTSRFYDDGAVISGAHDLPEITIESFPD